MWVERTTSGVMPGSAAVDVEAFAAAGSRGAGAVGLGDGGAFDGVALGGQKFVEEGSGETLGVGGGVDIDELLCELDRVDRHMFQHTLSPAMGENEADVFMVGVNCHPNTGPSSRPSATVCCNGLSWE